jgi:hypothetical protein
MNFPSENWVYNDWDDFDTASANVVGDYTLEVFARNVRAFSPPQQWSSKRLDYNALDKSNTALFTYQREGRLHTRDLRPAEALGPDPGTLQAIHSNALATSRTSAACS